MAVGVDPDRDHGRDVDDPATLADLLGQGIHPHVRVGAVSVRNASKIFRRIKR